MSQQQTIPAIPATEKTTPEAVTAPAPTEQKTQVVSKINDGTVDSILRRISDFQSTGDLVLPPNYIAENAVRAAWLVLQETVDLNKRPVLEVCSKESIANALLEMVTKGLSVVKKQCYFVAYGSQLVLEDSYIGKITIAKRDANVKEVNAVTIYGDDVFEFENDVETGRRKIIKHQQKLENMKPDNIVGAYAIVIYNDGTTDCEIMTMPQIRKAWEQGGSKGVSPAHKNFPDQMAEKTVINRALKIDVGSSDDSNTINSIDKTAEKVNHEIREKANSKVMDFEDATIVDDAPQPKSAIEKASEKSSIAKDNEQPVSNRKPAFVD